MAPTQDALYADIALAALATTSVLADDPGRAVRQVGVVDSHGGSATFSGDECEMVASGRKRDGRVCVGQIIGARGPLTAQQSKALLDRLVERAIILKIKGKTYRTPLVKSEDNPA